MFFKKSKESKPGLIFNVLPKVMKEVGAIEKSQKNSAQGYSFRGIDDIYNSIHKALSDNEVFCVPRVTKIERSERQTTSNKAMTFTVLCVDYTFYAKDGSHITASVVGEGSDLSDKGCNKAMSAAQKYAFIQVFCIPTEEPKDPEIDSLELESREAEERRKREREEKEKQEKIKKFSSEKIVQLKGLLVKVDTLAELESKRKTVEKWQNSGWLLDDDYKNATIMMDDRQSQLESEGVKA